MGGWAIATFASVEAPDSVKLQLIQNELSNTNTQVKQNTTDITTIKQKLDTDSKGT